MQNCFLSALAVSAARKTHLTTERQKDAKKNENEEKKKQAAVVLRTSTFVGAAHKSDLKTAEACTQKHSMVSFSLDNCVTFSIRSQKLTRS